MLGETIDDEVNQFKKDLRASGGVVNTIVVVTAARGIAGAENRALLEKKKTVDTWMFTEKYVHYL